MATPKSFNLFDQLKDGIVWLLACVLVSALNITLNIHFTKVQTDPGDFVEYKKESETEEVETKRFSNFKKLPVDHIPFIPSHFTGFEITSKGYYTVHDQELTETLVNPSHLYLLHGSLIFYDPIS